VGGEEKEDEEKEGESCHSVRIEEYRGGFVKGVRSGFGVVEYGNGQTFRGTWRHDQAQVGLHTVGAAYGREHRGEGGGEGAGGGAGGEGGGVCGGRTGMFAGDMRGATRYGMLSLQELKFEEFNQLSKLFPESALGGILHGRFDMGCDHAGNFWLRTFSNSFQHGEAQEPGGGGGGGGAGAGAGAGAGGGEGGARRERDEMWLDQVAEHEARTDDEDCDEKLQKGRREELISYGFEEGDSEIYIRKKGGFASFGAVETNEAQKSAAETVTGGCFGIKDGDEADALSSATQNSSSAAFSPGACVHTHTHTHKHTHSSDGAETSKIPNVVLMEGMTLSKAEGSKEPYDGINGRYELSEQMLNFRPVYVKETGRVAMWWANVDGQLSWVVGQADQVGSDSIWASILQSQLPSRFTL